MKILIVNGPNLNRLGKREPGIYGTVTMESYLGALREKFPELSIDYFQSNCEGALIDRLQEAEESEERPDGIVLNAGAYTHTSLALADCIADISIPVVEVHVSNVFRREEIRHHSLLSPVCKGTICGFGMTSYELGIRAICSGL